MNESILNGIAVGLATSWVIGVSVHVVESRIARLKSRRDINAAHANHRKHLIREHKSVATDFGEIVRPYSVADTDKIKD